jgi:uncharacterized protein
MGFGLIHFFLIWPGDILFSYALFGLGVLACISWSIRAQLVAALGLYLLGVLIYAAMMTLPWAIVATALGDAPHTADDRARLVSAVAETLARSAVPNAAIASGDYAVLVMHRLREQWSEPLSNALLFGLETFPLMLLGLALFRLGFFTGGLERAAMLRWGWAGVIAGALLHLAIGLVVQAEGFSYYGTLAAFAGWSALPRLWMVLGLAALLVAYAPSARGWLGVRIRAAGRVALTNYLGTSLAMMPVFHGWGLGLFGHLNRPQLYLVVLLAWAAMLAWPKPWLERFAYGPLEWLWRCLTYRRYVPLAR